MPTKVHTALMQSPIGSLAISCTDAGVTAVQFVEEGAKSSTGEHPHLSACIGQLTEYFDGKRKKFESLTLHYASTDFQRDVWETLLDVPFGENVTYAELAKAAGHNGAARAVGTAMRLNPLCIIVPCHRVIPESGGIGEYAGGEWRKEWLLTHEKR